MGRCINCEYKQMVESLNTPDELANKCRLNPDEIKGLVRSTIYGYFGNGIDRVRRLGYWYDVVQPLVNEQLNHFK